MSGATLLLGSTCNPASRDKFHSCSLAGYSDSPAVPCRLASLAKCQRTERTCLQTEAAQIRRNRLSIPSPRKSVPYKASIRYSSQINANELRLFLGETCCRALGLLHSGASAPPLSTAYISGQWLSARFSSPLQSLAVPNKNPSSHCKFGIVRTDRVR